jgi:hypothetical protein
LRRRRVQPSDQMTSSLSGFPTAFTFFFFGSFFIIQSPHKMFVFTSLPNVTFFLSGRVQSSRDVTRRDYRIPPGLLRFPDSLYAFFFFCFFHHVTSCLHWNDCNGPVLPSGLILVYSRAWISHPGPSSRTPMRPTNRKNRRAFLLRFFQFWFS